MGDGRRRVVRCGCGAFAIVAVKDDGSYCAVCAGDRILELLNELAGQQLAHAAGKAEGAAAERVRWQQVIAWSTPIPCKPEDVDFCSECLEIVDRSTCHCGDHVKDHGFHNGHYAVPMGCRCGYLTEDDRITIDAIRARGQSEDIDD